MYLMQSPVGLPSSVDPPLIRSRLRMGDRQNEQVPAFNLFQCKSRHCILSKTYLNRLSNKNKYIKSLLRVEPVQQCRLKNIARKGSRQSRSGRYITCPRKRVATKKFKEAMTFCVLEWMSGIKNFFGNKGWLGPKESLGKTHLTNAVLIQVLKSLLQYQLQLPAYPGGICWSL